MAGQNTNHHQKNDMQSTVTPTTARRLKDAGFPQPVPEVGQMWYNGEFEGFIRRGEGFKKLAYADDGVDDWFHHIADQAIFAPTATDILRELGSKFSLIYQQYEMNGIFYIEEKTGYDVSEVESDENPHEAAALAWLSKHEKPCPK